jgi:hypothetical protein
MRKKLAIDNQLGHKEYCELKSAGYDIIVEAGDRADEDWVIEAIDKGVDCIISPDLDIPNMLEREYSDALWIDYTQEYRNSIKKLIKRLDKSLKKS